MRRAGESRGKAPFPGFIPPALATTASRPPAGARWVHEVKFDGYRVQLHIHAETIKVFTRRGHDWTDRFKKIAGDAWHLNVKSAIIDGEVIVPGADGLSDFSVLQKALRARKPSDKLVMYAFDLLYLNGVVQRQETAETARPSRHRARWSLILSEERENEHRPGHRPVL